MRKHTFIFEGLVRGQSVTRFSNITERRNDYRPPHYRSANNVYRRADLNTAPTCCVFLSQTTVLRSVHFKKQLAEIWHITNTEINMTTLENVFLFIAYNTPYSKSVTSICWPQKQLLPNHIQNLTEAFILRPYGKQTLSSTYQVIRVSGWLIPDLGSSVSYSACIRIPHQHSQTTT